ncbi:alpha/beta fold hydrolase [Nocardia pseudovaccinii]|uniref:alpha/beta fold hydrolase n=1 Tax=Nocardia pseudovaccinii TaxID=189540 RepID=UPI003D9025A2
MTASKTYLLITGAYHGGWAWRPVADRLRADGHTVLTPTLPGLHPDEDPTKYSFPDIIESLKSLISQRDLKDVTLVAHSWGGSVGAALASAIPERIAKAIFWSAFTPGGAPIFAETPPEYQEFLAKLAAESGNNTVGMPFDVWSSAFINDGTPEVQLLTHQLLSPHPKQYFDYSVEPLDVEKFSKPVTYLYGEEDIALPREAWLMYASRVGATPVAVPGSHEALFTRPIELAEAFLKA